MICKNPTKEHAGRYTLLVKLDKDSKFTSAYLDVEGKFFHRCRLQFIYIFLFCKSIHNAIILDLLDKISYLSDSDPEFYFVEKLSEESNGLTNRPVTFKCKLNECGAKVKWFKGGQAVNVSNLKGFRI